MIHDLLIYSATCIYCISNKLKQLSMFIIKFIILLQSRMNKFVFVTHCNVFGCAYCFWYYYCSCISLSERCLDLTDPTNGMISCSLGVDGDPTEGDTCDYMCTTGYVISGDAMRTCGSNGMWTGSDPTCVGKKIQSYCIYFDSHYLCIMNHNSGS